MVILTLGIIAMIAVPRMSRAASNAKSSAITANVRVLQGAIDTYAAEHGNRDPARNPDGTVTTSAAAFTARLLSETDELGHAGGFFGPYLLRLPRNPANGLATIRIDGLVAGANLAGWRYDTAQQRLQPDHAAAMAEEVGITGTLGDGGDLPIEPLGP